MSELGRKWQGHVMQVTEVSPHAKHEVCRRARLHLDLTALNHVTPDPKAPRQRNLPMLHVGQECGMLLQHHQPTCQRYVVCMKDDIRFHCCSECWDIQMNEWARLLCQQVLVLSNCQ